MEFIDAPPVSSATPDSALNGTPLTSNLIGCSNLNTSKFHSQAYYTSRLLNFTSGKLNGILESENLDDYIINDMESFEIKIDEN
ncbi:kinase-like domain-containing protein [Rhizophagus irregularis DAOM 181602=DAOM 197198]|nr:hypothetical protein RirG_234990 [Rhizophagus irregularis DAOM 197198w]GET58292.1 kinase-like domain-containing protein [Rhizophagus irregularis DAOM 181602=DAOM 197198]